MDNIKAIERSIITNFRKPLWRRFIKGIQDYDSLNLVIRLRYVFQVERIQSSCEAITGITETW